MNGWLSRQNLIHVILNLIDSFINYSFTRSVYTTDTCCIYHWRLSWVYYWWFHLPLNSCKDCLRPVIREVLRIGRFYNVASVISKTFAPEIWESRNFVKDCLRCLLFEDTYNWHHTPIRFQHNFFHGPCKLWQRVAPQLSLEKFRMFTTLVSKCLENKILYPIKSSSKPWFIKDFWSNKTHCHQAPLKGLDRRQSFILEHMFRLESCSSSSTYLTAPYWT